eukprot:scaffold19764_cov114-Isochrysis_galbana.AAC.1
MEFGGNGGSVYAGLFRCVCCVAIAARVCSVCVVDRGDGVERRAPRPRAASRASVIVQHSTYTLRPTPAGGQWSHPAPTRATSAASRKPAKTPPARVPAPARAPNGCPGAGEL